MTDDPHRLSVVMGSTQRRGAWEVPAHLAVRVLWGDLELDLREAVFAAPLTTIEVEATMSNLEILVPPHLALAVEVQAHGCNVEDHRSGSPASGPRVVITGRIKLSNFEILPLAVGEPRPSGRSRGHRHGRHHGRHRQRWRELHAEREMWHRSHEGEARWRPWWLMARMRRRIFSWLALAFAGGIAVGVYAWPYAAWWHILIVAMVLSMASGAIAWRLTRPLLMAVRAARDLGDGKLDTRIDASAHGGEVRLLAVAINDMAGKLQQQMVDQRQLLAAVSHELRTPPGHMRVPIGTAAARGSHPRASRTGRARCWAGGCYRGAGGHRVQLCSCSTMRCWPIARRQPRCRPSRPPPSAAAPPSPPRCRPGNTRSRPSWFRSSSACRHSARDSCWTAVPQRSR